MKKEEFEALKNELELLIGDARVSEIITDFWAESDDEETMEWRDFLTGNELRYVELMDSAFNGVYIGLMDSIRSVE